MKKVLAIVAHCDDETLGAGGAIARHCDAGDYVAICVAADCRTARDPSLIPDLLPESADAFSKLFGSAGGAVHFLRFGGMTLDGNMLALTRAIEEKVGFIRPDVVYTHYWGDVNSDHRAVSRAVTVALRPSGAAQRILCFEVPSSTEWSWDCAFKPNVFVDVTETVERKISAMSKYASELRDPPHPRSLEALRARAAYWGQVAGCAYAEPFVLAREVVK